MPVIAKKQVAVPPGSHTGTIVDCTETQIEFDPKKGYQPAIVVTIQPDYRVEGAETLGIETTFSPVLNGMSVLSRFLTRLGAHPKEGAAWEPADIIGTKVAFTTTNVNGFARIVKDSMRPTDDKT